MSGVTELLGVIRRGDTKAVEDLLAAHPDLANARDEKGNSPVLMATYARKQHHRLPEGEGRRHQVGSEGA